MVWSNNQPSIKCGESFYTIGVIVARGSRQGHQILYDEIAVALSVQDILSGNIVEPPHFVTRLLVALRKTLTTNHAYNVRNVSLSSIWPTLGEFNDLTTIYR